MILKDRIGGWCKTKASGTTSTLSVSVKIYLARSYLYSK
jgi:hypothetical protein